MEARRVSLEASTCRQPVPQATIDRWQRQIKERSAQLLGIDGKIGAANKALRAARVTNNQPNNRTNNRAIKSLARLPDGIGVKPGPEVSPNNREIDNSPKPGRILFLEFFYQLVGENIDPRLVEVLERDAHSLVDEYRRVHNRERGAI
jgi:hypothetical protein